MYKCKPFVFSHLILRGSCYTSIALPYRINTPCLLRILLTSCENDNVHIIGQWKEFASQYTIFMTEKGLGLN